MHQIEEHSDRIVQIYIFIIMDYILNHFFQIVPILTGLDGPQDYKSNLFLDGPNVYWIGGSPGLYIKSVSARRGLGKGIDVRGWKSCRRFSLELEDYGTNTDSDLPIAIE